MSKKVVILKGGEGSGNHGHAGRHGLVGGSARGHNLIINTWAGSRPGARVPTEKEMNDFRSIVGILPEGIQRIRPNIEKISITVTLGSAETFGPSVYLDERYFLGLDDIEKRGWWCVASHEYIHTLVATNKKLNRIEYDYKPPFLYQHAAAHGDDKWGANNEQFTMVLTGYDDDPKVWLQHVLAVESYHHQSTVEEAQAQMDAVTTYLRKAKVW